MFTVKATYRSETRKFSFPFSSFPTYNQLNDQLSRVFPISTSYYLARLLFTQSPSAPFARILIGMEAHSEEEYEQHVRPFRGREWPNGLLRFSVYDEETPQETTNNGSAQQDGEDVLMADSHGVEGARRRPRRHEHRHGHQHGHHGHHRDHPRRGDFPPWPHHRPAFVAPPPPPFMPPFPPPPHTPPPPPPPPPPLPFFRSFFHPPSPPMPPPSLHRSPIVVPPPPLLSPHVAHPAPPLPSLPFMQPASQDDVRRQSPPPVDGPETPVERFFRRRGLRSVSSAPVLGPAFPIPPAPAPVPPPPPPRPVSLYGEIQVADPPQTTRPNRRAVIISDDSDELYTPGAPARVDGEDANRTSPDTCCDVERGKEEISNIIRTFKTDVDRVLSESLGMDPTDVWGATSTERQSNPATPVPSFNAERTMANQSPPIESAHSAEPEPPLPPDDPVIHVNVSCNMCREMIVGVRHKCLDCPDFDLCSLCLAAQPQSFGSHSKSHSLFAIEEPGGLWIHTIFEGDGTREILEPPVADEGPTDLMDINILESIAQGESHAQGEHAALVAEAPIRHATCEFCDTAIRGERFKCFDCPDFNTCSSCYVIVSSQHPGHSFAHLRDPKDLKHSSSAPPIHRANCSDCGKVISDVRYKCMHPACNDFDLCASCEALPIPVHPTSHTMLKIRDPDAYIPVVTRYGVQRVPTPATSASGSARSQEKDIEGSTDERSYAPLNVTVGGVRYNQFIPLDPDPLPTSIRSNVLLSEASPEPTTELVDISYPEFERNIHEESSEETVSSAFGVPVVIRESADSSQSGQYVPAAVPLLPVPSPPPALATEFFHAVPSLHQSNQYSEDLITGLHESDARPAPWWGQSAWVPPTPPAPLPVPLRTPSTPRRSRSPEPLVCFEEPDDMVDASAGTQATTTTLRPESDNGQSPTSLPHVPPMDFNELFDLASQFRHLLELPPVTTPPSLPPAPPSAPERKPNGSGAVSIVADDVSAPTELASTPVDDAGTPLSFVALLSKPEKTPRPGVLDGISPGRLLSRLLDSPSTASLSSFVTKNENKDVDEDAPLRASFVADNNIPDGQIFPPGAEFVKSWRMRNDGPGPWPADTELVFVAGDKLMIDTSERFNVGAVLAGEEVDVWTGEMKAPDVSGKYNSYWRLCDGKGRRFGHRIWIDICVTEPTKAPSTPEKDCASLAASSVVMPQSAPSNPSAPIPSRDESTTAPLLSDASSISLIDVPSDDEDDDSEVYEDSHSHFGSMPGNNQVLSPDVEYVVLSDDSGDI